MAYFYIIGQICTIPKMQPAHFHSLPIVRKAGKPSINAAQNAPAYTVYGIGTLTAVYARFVENNGSFANFSMRKE